MTIGADRLGVVQVEGLGDLSPVEADKLGRKLCAEALRAADASRLLRYLVRVKGLSLEVATELASQVMPVLATVRPQYEAMKADNRTVVEFLDAIWRQIRRVVRTDDVRIVAIAQLLPITFVLAET